jgi:hypothetical protein
MGDTSEFSLDFQRGSEVVGLGLLSEERRGYLRGVVDMGR